MNATPTVATPTDASRRPVRLGLRENWPQFSLLVVVNIAVGGLVGLERTVALGLGTAMVYPALIASVSDHAHPAWRANALGTYRFWRDIGYAAGALVAGVLADMLGLNATVIAAAVLTAASGLLAARWITDRTRI
ncbi:hypothetical protein GCM10027073_64590 [Streptomyces chlorus]|uniref:MFS transporter n=1 Tax=Streptomyces chlorus TaxID=887452 RepID=A0ABW1DYK8_9ACTN